MDEIRLNKTPGLPKNIRLISLGDKIIYAKWHLGALTILSQEQLKKLLDTNEAN